MATMSTIRCTNCGTVNRIPPDARGVPHCGKCGTELPWIVDVPPEEFESYRRNALGKGSLTVASSPLTRSSYHAGDDFAALRAAREAKLAASA